ncbi:MAG: 50S ribosomal protein L21e [Candidatus Methanomethylophilaceae archaeon]|nr:50S ribosomal protein L21e [Candidatus Methanomethylophilaceae archaeon]MDY5872175.1 50S ribosomal protein L21e [Candidatus Methanomethylophilaceae archaeon]
MKASKGTRTKTRTLLQKKPRARGLSPITRGFQSFEDGEKVNIIIDPSVHKGMPFSRFHGLTGVVIGQRGAAFEVSVKDGNKTKIVVARPEHLVKTKI